MAFLTYISLWTTYVFLNSQHRILSYILSFTFTNTVRTCDITSYDSLHVIMYLGFINKIKINLHSCSIYINIFSV